MISEGASIQVSAMRSCSLSARLPPTGRRALVTSLPLAWRRGQPTWFRLAWTAAMPVATATAM